MSDNDKGAQILASISGQDIPTAHTANGSVADTNLPASGRDHSSPSGLSGRAAFLVMALASITVGAIIALLALHIWVVEKKYERSDPTDWTLVACQDAPCAQEVRLFTLESEAQGLRTDRIRTAQLSRLFVFIVAEVAGFTLLVMGAVLIFDRVIARDQENLVTVYRWTARSEFPGFLMCFLGTVMVIWTVQSANRTAGYFEVFDRPVFLYDPNWLRNELGLPSGSRPNTSFEGSQDAEDRSAPPPSPPLSPDQVQSSNREPETPSGSASGTGD